MLRLQDFYEASMTQLRRELTGERIDGDFVLAYGDTEVAAFFPDISNAEIVVVLGGDDDLDDI